MFKRLRKTVSFSILLILMLLLMLASSANASDLVIDNETMVSWDSYVQDHAEVIAVTQVDLTSEPQTVDLSQTDVITPDSQPSAFSALGVQSLSSDIKRYSVLVLDVSGSMSGAPITYTKQAAIKFCQQVLEAEGENYVAVVSFNTSATTVCNFSNDLNALTNSINALYYTGSTSQHAGLVLADSLLDNVSASGAIKNIVLMSDGLPETGADSFNGPYTSSDYYGYYYANAAYEKAKELKTRYSIYSLGFFHSLSGSYLSFGRRFMEDLQNAGYYEVINPDDLDFEFGKIADDILKKSGVFKYAGQIVQP
jgi:hypothetical protein